MTEELKQKAEEWVYKNTICYGSVSVLPTRENAYIAGATENTELLAKHILELQKDKGNLTDKVTELEAQIEKMKCCENCGWYYLQQHWRESKEINESRMFHCGTCGNKRNWKLKEIKEK